MRRRAFIIPTFKEYAKGTEIISHRLMLQSGLVTQVMSGIYAWLPLGLRVLRNIEKIVHEEMSAVGCQEVLFPLAQPLSLWEESGRVAAYGKELLIMRDRHENNLLFCPTAEEVSVHACGRFLKSYKDLPQCVYQIQWKFRDEIRPRFGVMRAREFLMKDAYSFDASKDEAIQRYHTMARAYMRVFKRLGFACLPVHADNGPIGGGLSHEFSVLCESGESTVGFSEALETMMGNFEGHDVEEILHYAGVADDCQRPDLPQQTITRRAIELGHIFYFGSKYSKGVVEVQTRDNATTPVEMGSYGIGISRIVGALIECFHDDKGVVWPESVAPFRVYMVGLGLHDECVQEHADSVYRAFKQAGVDVLYDDRLDQGAGRKLYDAELIGCPWILVVGKKSSESGMLELRHRATGDVEYLVLNDILEKMR